VSDDVSIFSSLEFRLAAAELMKPDAPREVRVWDETGKKILTLKRDYEPGAPISTKVANISFNENLAHKRALFFLGIRAMRRAIHDENAQQENPAEYFAKMKDLREMMRAVTSKAPSVLEIPKLVENAIRDSTLEHAKWVKDARILQAQARELSKG
jgi:hypothetical protein